MNKKAQELAMHDKDTGSSEIQIALLTEKIEISLSILSNSRRTNIHLLDC